MPLTHTCTHESANTHTYMHTHKRTHTRTHTHTDRKKAISPMTGFNKPPSLVSRAVTVTEGANNGFAASFTGSKMRCTTYKNHDTTATESPTPLRYLKEVRVLA